MHYHFKIHNDKDGLWAECIELKNCFSYGYTLEELKENMKEILDIFLSELSVSDTDFPIPENIDESHDIVKVKVNSQTAFAVYLRLFRVKHKLSQKEVADKLGFKKLYFYQRLESSLKANPELKTLEKIKEIFPELDLNYIF